jgi:hypothetical protein
LPRPVLFLVHGSRPSRRAAATTSSGTKGAAAISDDGPIFARARL